MIQIDFEKRMGKIKPMNGVNNGPAGEKKVKSNFIDYKRAKIPFARNHDAAYCSVYGESHTVDVSAIFPDFDADVEDESSYDFFYTDEYIKNCLAAGTETFYRLGHRIENCGLKKYGTLPPKDFLKWAKICEHIILHYNFGWANGYDFKIRYWEIWNEPELRPEDAIDNPTWGGTKKEFFEFFKTTAIYLKSKFPSLKIGGPALASHLDWAEEFLQTMKAHGVGLDFFSWHIYTKDPYDVLEKIYKVRKLLDRCGYEQTESILDEWNYVIDFSENYVRSIERIIGIKGAAFSASVMNLAQNAPLDLLMYYDARLNTSLNGMFDFYTYRPLKGYYPFYMWGLLSELSDCVLCESSDRKITATAAIKDGKAAVMIAHFSCEEETDLKEIPIEIKGLQVKIGKVYSLDDTHSFEKIAEFTGNRLTLNLKPDSVTFIALSKTEETIKLEEGTIWTELK